MVGITVGDVDGDRVGATVGEMVGLFDGATVGESVGTLVGDVVRALLCASTETKDTSRTITWIGSLSILKAS